MAALAYSTASEVNATLISYVEEKSIRLSQVEESIVNAITDIELDSPEAIDFIDTTFEDSDSDDASDSDMISISATEDSSTRKHRRKKRKLKEVIKGIFCQVVNAMRGENHDFKGLIQAVLIALTCCAINNSRRV